MVETDQFILRTWCTTPQLYLLKMINRNVISEFKFKPTKKTVITLPVVIFRKMIRGAIKLPINIKIDEKGS